LDTGTPPSHLSLATALTCCLDLNTLFNWNTKQVFLFLKAVYPSTKKGEPASEAIIWDAIIPAASAPWHVNHWTHPLPKGTKPKKTTKSKQKAGENESPYPRGEIHLANQRPKYQITDISGKLQNRDNVTLELSWNIQPWVGALVWGNKVDFGVWEGLRGGVSEPFEFPAIGAKPVKKEDLGTDKGKEGYRLEVGGEHAARKGGK
jgi:signal peptidase complex subunit 3